MMQRSQCPAPVPTSTSRKRRPPPGNASEATAATLGAWVWVDSAWLSVGSSCVAATSSCVGAKVSRHSAAASSVAAAPPETLATGASWASVAAGAVSAIEALRGISPGASAVGVCSDGATGIDSASEAARGETSAASPSGLALASAAAAAATAASQAWSTAVESTGFQGGLVSSVMCGRQPSPASPFNPSEAPGKLQAAQSRPPPRTKTSAETTTSCQVPTSASASSMNARGTPRPKKRTVTWRRSGDCQGLPSDSQQYRASNKWTPRGRPDPSAVPPSGTSSPQKLWPKSKPPKAAKAFASTSRPAYRGGLGGRPSQGARAVRTASSASGPEPSPGTSW
mmetsp:Transcript_122274/g.273044  ORF Transcript_122274/g.273044 Transcript_122274/m.273044 type:complete len:340 (-) Transcript_122274:123-1142(-)